MVELIIVLIYMNIGIFWTIHRGVDSTSSDFFEKIYIQIHMILWPLSIIVTLIHDLYCRRKRRLARLKRVKQCKNILKEIV
jgi:hypothetical protein